MPTTSQFSSVKNPRVPLLMPLFSSSCIILFSAGHSSLFWSWCFAYSFISPWDPSVQTPGCTYSCNLSLAPLQLFSLVTWRRPFGRAVCPSLLALRQSLSRYKNLLALLLLGTSHQIILPLWALGYLSKEHNSSKYVCSFIPFAVIPRPQKEILNK